jgi:hypothetical protein
MKNDRATKMLRVNELHTRPDVLEVARQGYLDRVDSRSFATEYETWPIWQQRNYEFGRLMAAECLADRGKPYVWSTCQKFPRTLVKYHDIIAEELVYARERK